MAVWMVWLRVSGKSYNLVSESGIKILLNRHTVYNALFCISSVRWVCCTCFPSAFSLHSPLLCNLLNYIVDPIGRDWFLYSCLHFCSHEITYAEQSHLFRLFHYILQAYYNSWQYFQGKERKKKRLLPMSIVH